MHNQALKLTALAAEYASVVCPTINGGSGKGVSTKIILQVLAAELGTHLKPVFSSKPKIGDPNTYIADMQIAEQWGWKPKRNLQNQISSYVEWYRQCQ